MVLEVGPAPGNDGITADPATVLICNGGPIVGQAMGPPLRTADRAAKYAATNEHPEQAGTLEGVRVPTLGPSWDARRHADAVGAADNAPGRPGILAPGLGESLDESEVNPEHLVPWPRRTEEPTRLIRRDLAD